MISAHLKKLRQRTRISPEEERLIRDLVSEVRQVRADETVIHAGEELTTSMMLLEGWMARSKDLQSGDRQFTELHVRGDFVDLHGFALKRLDHDLLTLTECSIGLVPHDRLTRLTEAHPRLMRVYWLMTNIDAAVHRETALSLGQRSAIGRMAHLFCELYLRLEIVGLARDGAYEFPLTQRELAECLGLTVVHANRTLQELRRRSLLELENRHLTILDRPGLEGIAEFDPGYLYLTQTAI
jgi:CRP-like cAMP-binding protein